MDILYTAPFDKGYLNLISNHVGKVIPGVPEEDRLLGRDEMVSLLNHHRPQGIIVEVNVLDREILDQVNFLEVIAVCRSGTNNIDLQAATEKGILVINTPGRNAVAVAEWTVALMINIARNFYQGAHLIQTRSWMDMVKTCYDLEGYELAGRTVGIVGIGSIGKALARRLLAWEVGIVGCDPFVSQEDVTDLGIRMMPLEQLLIESDYVVLLAAATKENQGMIGKREINLMKPSAYLINSARASLVNEDALLNALRSKRIAGAALDVHAQEPLPHNSPWLTLDNVLLTPHLGGATKDTITRHSRMIYEDLLRYQKKEVPRHLVNVEAWSHP